MGPFGLVCWLIKENLGLGLGQSFQQPIKILPAEPAVKVKEIDQAAVERAEQEYSKIDDNELAGYQNNFGWQFPMYNLIPYKAKVDTDHIAATACTIGLEGTQGYIFLRFIPATTGKLMDGRVLPFQAQLTMMMMISPCRTIL